MSEPPDRTVSTVKKEVGSTVKKEVGDYKVQGRQSQQRYKKYHGNYQFNQKKKTAPTSTRTSFSDNTEELDDCTFDVGLANQGELFTKNLQKLAEYAGRNNKESRDISYAIENVSETDFSSDLQTLGTAGGEEVNKMILAREVDSYVKRKATYRQNKESIYAIILGECTEVMRAKLKSLHSFSTEASPKSDGIKLLKLIRQISYEFESQRYPFLSVHNAVILK